MALVAAAAAVVLCFFFIILIEKLVELYTFGLLYNFGSLGYCRYQFYITMGNVSNFDARLTLMLMHLRDLKMRN